MIDHSRQVHATQILQKLWLGNEATSQSYTFIKNNNIQVIINVTKHIPFINANVYKIRIPINDPGFLSLHIEKNIISNKEKYLTLPFSLNQPDINYLYNNLITILNFMNECINKNKTILIHCHAGSQRSAIIVAGYLMVYKKFSFRKAINFILSKRPLAFSYGTSINFKNSLKCITHKLI